MAVQSNGLALKHLSFCSEELKKMAVENKGWAIEYIKNPTEEINKLLQSGAINQQQLNQAQQMAQQMQSIFKNIK